MLLFTFLHPLPDQLWSWRWQPILPMWGPGPWLQKEQTKSHLQIIVLDWSNLPEVYPKEWCKALISVSPNLKFREEKWQTQFENVVRMDEKYAVIKVKILEASPFDIHFHYHTSAGGRPSLPEMGTPSQNLVRPVSCTTWGCLKLGSNSVPLGTETRPSGLCCARKRWSQAGKKRFSRWTWAREPSWLYSQIMPMVPLCT